MNQQVKNEILVLEALKRKLKPETPKVSMEDTGGGCAWIRVDLDDIFLAITEEDGCNPPEYVDVFIQVGVYLQDEEETWTGLLFKFDSIDDFIKRFWLA